MQSVSQFCRPRHAHCWRQSVGDAARIDCVRPLGESALDSAGLLSEPRLVRATTAARRDVLNATGVP